MTSCNANFTHRNKQIIAIVRRDFRCCKIWICTLHVALKVSSVMVASALVQQKLISVVLSRFQSYKSYPLEQSIVLLLGTFVDVDPRIALPGNCFVLLSEGQFIKEKLVSSIVAHL